METEFAVFLIAALGALALAARALGSVSQSIGNMASTVKALNDELQETIRERRAWNEERGKLKIDLAALAEKATGQQTTIDALECDIARITGELDSAKAEIATLRAEKEAQRQTILNLEIEIGRLQFKLQETTAAKEKAEAEIERLRHDFEQLRSNGPEAKRPGPDMA